MPDGEKVIIDQYGRPLNRRDFIRGAGAVIGAAALGIPAAAKPETPAAESAVKALYQTLSPGQREKICLPWSSPKRTMVQANWGIVDAKVKDIFSADQQRLVTEVLKGLTTPEWYPKLLSQMQNDMNGLGEYHVAMFGDPSGAQFEWVITGRHCTLRADGHSNKNAAFGGPIFYGHAPKETEDADHPGNIYWHQAKKANAVFAALDGNQRKLALLNEAPAESQITLRGPRGPLPGIPIEALSRDQKSLVTGVMHDLIAPYRPSDAAEVMRDIDANGGLDKIHLAFYKQDDLGSDGVWDIWRLEGPGIVWHFRGAPHVHTWVHVARDPAQADGHV